MPTKLLVFSALCSLAFAKSMDCRMKVHESVSAPPQGYVSKGPAPADTELNLRIALAQSDPDGLIDALYNVSTPGSLAYGEHLSKEDVEKFAAPTAQTSDAVKAWLNHAGVNATPISAAGDWLSIALPVNQANKLFDADFAIYTHSETGKQTIRTMKYSIPTELKDHIDLVHPMVAFPSPVSLRPVVSTSSDLERRATKHPANCSTSEVTPACVESLYDIPPIKVTQRHNQLAVSGFENEFANQADLQTFLEQFQPDIKGATFTLQTIDNGTNPQNGSEAGFEANSDIQYAISISHGVPTTFISAGPNNTDGDLDGHLDMALFLLGESKLPQVLTTSYGFDESDLPRKLSHKLCHVYAQLGARGMSLLFGSGDGGVSGLQSQTCNATFVPTSPSGCPFVTSVGATQLVSSHGGETAAPFSSGGFSDFFFRPKYQADAVKSYLSSIGSTNSGLFNASGRAYPDVSAIGTNLSIIIDGRLKILDGTSFSSPIFAGMIALINDALLRAGKRQLGFLNPFLYKNPRAFHDITTGSNPGCNTTGFPALKGWDAVTGLGTPNFKALKEAALKAARVPHPHPIETECTMQDVLSV
ncbi:uncharacterized protein PHACADRAFT_207479 [Phanerochaete carnosa HHB-10118-sp]|uniref:tripeptidyl-peptidase II n=1 Tax=Phanerochaete carnosa (strain HHB-10118-sp) TaxID=650164 RepID=K5X742_PHACS|nr:uncharacterized protein PHACADRAFT_207479 [Phanerochaete carnosa HHB-10118-sp]EKM58692.1 hypothetical protein PHACADRAFT_207479 [Phanerochaete carnosa HHB-10118-sp]